MNNQIVFFDGVCAMCNSFVLFLLDKDKKGELQFVSLQSSTAKNILLKHRVKIDSKNLSTIYYVRNGKILNRSNAILSIFYDLGFPYKAIYLFKIIPLFIRNYIYWLIAKNRYLFFKNNSSCKLLSLEQKNRIID